MKVSAEGVSHWVPGTFNMLGVIDGLHRHHFLGIPAGDFIVEGLEFSGKLGSMEPPDCGGAVGDSKYAWLFDSFGDEGSGQEDA